MEYPTTESSAIPIIFAVIIGALWATSPVAAPLGTTFQYQGQLLQMERSANGAFDFEFRVYDSLQAGNQIGPTVPAEDIQVTNGLFAVDLDFGQGVFTGSELWLEIAVRPGFSTGPFTVLAPRQQLTGAPYALWSTSTDDANLLDGLDSSEYLHADGSVPADELVVNGSLEVDEIVFPDGSSQSSSGFPGTQIGSTSLEDICFGHMQWSATFSPPADARYGLVYAGGGLVGGDVECFLQGILVDHATALVRCRHDPPLPEPEIEFSVGWGTCSGFRNGTFINGIAGRILWYR